MGGAPRGVGGCGGADRVLDLASGGDVMRIIEGVVRKCVHEGLDLDWCDCPEDVRQELNVQLPTPEEWLEMHGEEDE